MKKFSVRIWGVILISFLAVLLPRSLPAQRTSAQFLSDTLNATSTDCSVAHSCVWMELPHTSTSVGVTLSSAAFSGTAVLEESGDGGNTFSTVATLTAPQATTTYPTQAYTDFRVRLSGYTSGGMTTSISLGTGAAAWGGGGNTTSTTLSTNAVPKANGPNSVINSSLTDNGTAVSTAEQIVNVDGSYGSNMIRSPSACETSYGPTTVNTGSATTTTGLSCLPANAVIDAVVYRVTTAITTAASFTVGITGTVSKFCSTQSTLTLGATGICAAQTGTAGSLDGASAAAIVVTFNTTPGAGAIRLIVFWHGWTPPTS